MSKVPLYVTVLSHPRLLIMELGGSFRLGLFVHGKMEVDELYRGASPIRNSAPLGPYGRTMPRALQWSLGEVQFLTSEKPLYGFRLGLLVHGKVEVDELPPRVCHLQGSLFGGGGG